MMKFKRRTLDELMSQVRASDIERTKCRGSGKVRFRSYAEAKFFMHWLKWRYSKRKRHRQRKDGIRKPNVRYVYECELCGGFHLTNFPRHKWAKLKKRMSLYWGGYILCCIFSSANIIRNNIFILNLDFMKQFDVA